MQPTRRRYRLWLRGSGWAGGPSARSASHAAARLVVATTPAVDLPDAGVPAAVTPAAVVLGVVMPVARMVQVIYLAWPETSARGATVMPSNTTGRNGNPATAIGGTGWCAQANSTGNDFSRSLSAEGSANVPWYSGRPVTSSIRGRSGRLRARSSCDRYSVTGWMSPTRYNPYGNHLVKSALSRIFFGAAITITAVRVGPGMLGYLVRCLNEQFPDRAGLISVEREIT